MAMTYEELIALDPDALIDALDNDEPVVRTPTGATADGSATRELPTERHSPAQVVEEALPGEPTKSSGVDLDNIDPKDLVKHPRVAGILGNKLQAERATLRQEIEAEYAAKAQKEADDNLLRTDPYGFRDTVEERKAREDAQRTHDEELAKVKDEVRTTVHDDIDNKILYRFWNEQPVEVQKQLSGKNYDGDEHESRYAYIQDLMKTRIVHELQVARSRWERDAVPALRKQLAEGGQQVNQPVATRNGPPARVYDAAAIENMSLNDLSDHLDEVLASILPD